jgi:hypothetical protein
VQAAVSAVYELSAPAVTSPKRFERAVRRLAAPGARSRLESTFGAVDPSLVAAFRHGSSVFRGTPVGYRVDRFTSTTASVAIWTVTLAASRDFPATAQWRTLVIKLAWTRDGWKVANGDGYAGPDPTTPLRRLASAASRFRSFDYVP